MRTWTSIFFCSCAGIFFGHVGDDPDAGEVGDGKGRVGRLHHLADGDLALQNRAASWGDDGVVSAQLAGGFQLPDLGFCHAQAAQLGAARLHFGVSLQQLCPAALQLARGRSHPLPAVAPHASPKPPPDRAATRL